MDRFNFVAGDLVALKSGSPPMVVCPMPSERMGNVIVAFWTDGGVKHADVWMGLLQKVSEMNRLQAGDASGVGVRTRELPMLAREGHLDPVYAEMPTSS